MSHKKQSLEDRLVTVSRKPSAKSHITIKTNLCTKCLTHICTQICPAGVYEWNKAKKAIDISHENCLECGACHIACEMQNIDWSYPLNGTGVAYRHG